MRISVIICSWNSEPYLAKSINSLLAQGYSDIQYIFVDGGSTDGTLERVLGRLEGLIHWGWGKP